MVYTRAIGLGEKRQLWVGGIVVAVGLLLFAALCAGLAVEAAAASDTWGVVRLTVMAVVQAMLGVTLLVKGRAIHEWWRHVDDPPPGR